MQTQLGRLCLFNLFAAALVGSLASVELAIAQGPSPPPLAPVPLPTPLSAVGSAPQPSALPAPVTQKLPAVSAAPVAAQLPFLVEPRPTAPSVVFPDGGFPIRTAVP